MTVKILSILPNQLTNLKANTSDSLILLDIRSIAEVSEGYIKNSVHIPVNELTVDKIETLVNKVGTEKTNLVVYCHSGIRSFVFLNSLSQDDMELLNDLQVTLYNLDSGIAACDISMITKG